jgi:hypothetical protein
MHNLCRANMGIWNDLNAGQITGVSESEEAILG